MTNNKILPAWAQFESESFDRLGLIAERRVDASTACNLPVIGGLAGCDMAPEWDRPCTGTEMLALSIVVRMTDHPDPINAPLAQHLTPRYHQMAQFTSLLDDGTRVSAAQLVLSKHLQMALLMNDSPRETLTISLAEITEVLKEGIRRHYG